MSTLIVQTEKIEKIIKHPNADKLDIATVKGWEVIVQKDLYKVNDLIIYVPPEAVLPVKLSDKLGVTQYLSKHGKVKIAKLRGEYSEGLIIPINRKIIGTHLLIKLIFKNKIGVNVKKDLGITKYDVHKLPQNMQGNAEKEAMNEIFNKYTNIENYKNFNTLFKEGDEVVITEKIHGTSFRVGYVDGKFFVGSHNMVLKDDEYNRENNLYWKIAIENDLEEKLKPYDGYQFFGEIYGPGIQKKFSYGLKKPEVRFFDIKDDKGNYLPHHEAFNLIKLLDLKYVNILMVGYYYERYLGLAEGQSSHDEGTLLEGIVIKDVNEEKEENRQKRKILKVISNEYLLYKGKQKEMTDFH